MAAMNPCSCGYYGDSRWACRCRPQQVQQYQSKVSGPLLDRIDIHIDVPSVKYRDLCGSYSGENSGTIRKRVMDIRALQNSRLSPRAISYNAMISDRDVK
ncbi:MAG: ATP-binding protein [Syntrophales bacterium]|jgi:magnesium chelatase family protein